MLKVCFDCDDTLYNLADPFLKTMREFVPRVFEDGSNLEQMYQEYRQFGEDLFDWIQQGILIPDDSGILRIHQLNRKYELGLSLDDCLAFQNRYKENQYQVQMNPDFYAFLKKLPAEKAIFTNGQSAHQRAKLKSLQADQLVDPKRIFVSQEAGYAKPHLKAFQAIAENPRELADWYYVGDNYENDMEGAYLAGMKTIHFNRHHQQEGPCSEYTVYTESDLMALLEELAERYAA